MADASNMPVRSAPREIHTDDFKQQQKPSFSTREELDEIVLATPEQLQKDYAEHLAFLEEPVTIRVERTSEKFAPRVIDVWCNGKGAEVVINGRWVSVGVIPVGMPVTTKRKYVEILARAKHEAINTRVVDPEAEQPDNKVDSHVSSRAPFSVIEDRSPKAAAWLSGLVTFG